MIVDAHAHLGVDLVFEETRDEAEILGTMDANGVDATVLQGMFGALDLEAIGENHDRIARFAADHPGRIFGMITMNPYLHEGDFYNEAKRCVRDLGFVGMKLHPLAFACSPTNKRAGMMWEICRELSIPIMVHTGSGAPLSLPSLVIGRCREFPDVACVLAHTGMIIYSAEAFLAAELCDNVYLETSWTAPHHIAHAIRDFGAERVLFAADESGNLPAELEKYRSLGLRQDVWEQVMGKTANQLFCLGL